jgi:hypothetical protein
MSGMWRLYSHYFSQVYRPLYSYYNSQICRHLYSRYTGHGGPFLQLTSQVRRPLYNHHYSSQVWGPRQSHYSSRYGDIYIAIILVNNEILCIHYIIQVMRTLYSCYDRCGGP